MHPNHANFVTATNQSPRVSTATKIIREGSSVLVRIISEKGGGKYEASVAGNRVTITSSKTLKPGETFTGKISLAKNQILISKENITLQTENLQTHKFMESENVFEKINTPPLSNLLNSLNLPSDNLSLHLVLQFKQLGLTLKPEILKMIRTLAEKSSNPKKTIEKLSIMIQKNIPLSQAEDFIFDIEDFVDDEKNKNQNDDDLKNQYKFISENFSYKQMLMDFFNSLINLETNTKNIFTLSNHLGFKKNSNESSWISIPFQIENISESKKDGDGMLRFLLSADGKNLLKVGAEINIPNNSHKFMIDLKNKKTVDVKIASENENKNPLDLKKQLEKSISKNVQVQNISFQNFNYTCCSSETLDLAGGFA